MQTLTTILSYLAIVLWVFGLYLAFFSHLRSMFLEAVKVIWKRKYLWLLAFFAGLSAYGGEVNFLFQRGSTVASLQGYLDGIRTAILEGEVDRLYSSTQNLFQNNLAPMLGFIAIGLLMIAVVAWLIIMSQAAIVRIIGRSQQGKPTGLTDGLAIGTEKFWTLVQLNIVGLLIGWSVWIILTAVPSAIFLITKNAGWSIVAYIGSILSIAASIATIFLVQFATAGIVLQNSKLMPAIIDAWRLFTRNMVSSLEMAIAIFTVNLTLSYLIIAQLLFFFVAYTLSGFIAIVTIIIILYAMLSALSFAAWTIYYLKLVEGKTPSKLGQWTNRLANFAGQQRAAE